MRRPGNRKASGRGVRTSAPHARAAKPAESHCPVSAASGPRRPDRVQPEVGGPTGARRGDARQKAAGRRRGGARPGTPTLTRPAGGGGAPDGNLGPSLALSPRAPPANG